MIPEWFQMSLRHFATTIFEAGKLKPKDLLFIQLFILQKSRMFIQNKYSFIKLQNIHSKQLLIFFESWIFIQKNYSFLWNPEYSLKKMLTFLKEAVSAKAKTKTKTRTKTKKRRRRRQRERFSDLVTLWHIDYSWDIEKLYSWHWGLVTESQRVTWTPFFQKGLKEVMYDNILILTLVAIDQFQSTGMRFKHFNCHLPICW